MAVSDFDRALAHNLPGEFLKDLYPRAMRWLARRGLFRGETVVRTRYGFDLHVNRIDSIKWLLRYYREFEPLISASWKNFLPQGGTVVDIGANIGYHSLLAASCVGPTGKVVAFEPSSRIFRELCANVALNGAAQIAPQNMAISNAAGPVNLYYAGEDEQGHSSMIRSAGQGETVQAITFAQIAQFADLAGIDLIKIDVEGAEPLVVESLLPVVGQLKPGCAIFLEIGFEHDGSTLIDPLLAAGFQARQIANEYRTSFYRNPGPVVLRPVDLRPGELFDVVLCRDEGVFARMERPRAGS